MSIPTPIDTLARTIWGESRGEGYTGMCAVANVIMNRVKYAKWWGHDIIDVCLKPYQFSCWNKNDPNLPKLEAVTDADPLFGQCLKIAMEAANGELKDVTDGATSYYDKRMRIAPVWAAKMVKTVDIGHHAFFKEA